MTTESSGRPPEREGPKDDEDAFHWPTGSDSAADVGKTAARGLLAAFVYRVMFLQSLVWLLLGAGLLAGTWTLVRGELDRRAAVAAYSGRAGATIERPWWRLSLSRDLLGNGTNWMAATSAEVCAHLRFRPGGGEETVTAYCRRLRGGLHGASALTWEEALGPMPVRWVDAAGMPRIELRLSPALDRWLDEHGAEADPFYDAETFVGPERARRWDRLLGSIWREIDDPFLRLLEEWSKPRKTVEVVYPPADPARAVPRVLLAEGAGGGPFSDWRFAIPLGLFGVIAWGAGCYLVAGGRRWLALGLTVAGLLAVPWAAGRLGTLVSYVWDDADLALEFVRTEMLHPPPALVLDPEERADDPDAVRVTWTLESSYYAPLLKWIELAPPAEAGGSNAVLRSLEDQVARQAAALPDDDLSELLAWAASVQERGQGEEVGLLFVDAALAAEDDEARPEEVRRGARRVLQALERYPPSDNAYRLAVAERARLLARAAAP